MSKNKNNMYIENDISLFLRTRPEIIMIGALRSEKEIENMMKISSIGSIVSSSIR